MLACMVALSACAKDDADPVDDDTDTPEITESESPDRGDEDDDSESPDVTPDEDLFVFTRDNYPRMDGSTATQPLGQAIACVLLGEPREDVADLAVFNKTTTSYRNLIAGNCDIVIAAEPNSVVFDEMAEQDFEMEMTPFAMDALVFVVNEDNPVDNLTISELQRIYTGEITNWSEVGGEDMKIDAFQRNETSGSQVLMQKLVMDGLEMTKPPVTHTIGEMEGLIEAVKSFDGSPSAIGYTVYYYAEDMEMADGLKILQIDGVEPNDETIAAGEYAFLNPYYVAISKDTPEDSPVRVMYDWILSAEGQHLVGLEGYVPVGTDK